MDAFYASVEQRDDPSLRGRPVAVGGPGRRGVVAAASYEARRFGVHSAMPTAQALRRCPELVVLPPRFEVYREVSRAAFAIFESFTPLVEPLSLDEAFLDLRGTGRLHGGGAAVARGIKRRVREELSLVVSVGLAPNKQVAKIASDLGKPDGLVVVRPEDLRRFLGPLPVSRLLGVGQVTERRLRGLGVRTIGELAAMGEDQVLTQLGRAGRQLWQLARGNDTREVTVERTPDSIGHEDTFDQDIDDLDTLAAIVQEQSDRVATRLRAGGYLAGTVVLKLRTADFKTRSRQKRLARPTCDGQVIGEAARGLLARAARERGAVRLTGVTATALVPEAAPRQLTFDEPQLEAGERLGHTMDRIASRYGRGAIVRGSAIPPRDAAAEGEQKHREGRRKEKVET
jgi:DNA polymerase-4